MGAVQFAALIVQGLIFLLWTAAMFRTLFRLTRTAATPLLDSSGGPIRMFARNLKAMGRILHDPTFAPDRRRLLILTALLFATMAGTALLIPA